MKKRVISGTVYVIILLGFFLLKAFVNDLFFDLLVYFFAVVGTIEIVRAVGEKITKPQKICAMIFSIVTIPTVALLSSKLFFENNYGVLSLCICFFVFAVAVLCLFVTDYKNSTIENVGTAFLCGIYPTVLLSLLVLTNHVVPSENLAKYAFDSNLAILFIFVISPCADCMALFVGMGFKKFFPKKMAPEISPNKTVVGSIGGLIGGVISAIILYFVYNAICGTFDNMPLMILLYAVVGLLAALATEFGDLVESGIKRKLDIKDMGKIMPGHGGVLDRVDGTLFATMVVYVSFAIVHAIANVL